MSGNKIITPRSYAEDEEHYREAWQTFRNGNNMQDAKLQLTKLCMPKVLLHISSKSSESITSVLGIGSREGENDVSILENITKHQLEKGVVEKASIYNRVVEPEAKGIAEFTNTAEAWKEKNKDRAEVKFDMVQETFQQYQSRIEQEDKKFQFIHFIGCIYFMDPEDAIRHCLEKELASDGVIIVACLGNTCFLARYREKFHDSGICPIPPGPYESLTTKTILEIARKNNWRHEYHEASWYKDVTVLAETPESRESQMILDFVTRIENFSAVTSKEKVDKVIGFLLDESDTKPDGRRVIEKKNTYGAVLIFGS